MSVGTIVHIRYGTPVAVSWKLRWVTRIGY